MKRYVFIVLALSPACGTVPEQTSVLPFDSVFDTVVIRVQEDETDLVVAPSVRMEADGFLYADMAEARVRRYGQDGALEWATGGQGDGPGEYTRPSDAVRIPDGRVLVFDYGRMTVLSSNGDSVLEIRPHRFLRLEEVEVIDESRVLVAGGLPSNRPGDPQRPMLHVWDWVRDTVLNSFFHPFATTPHTDLVQMASWVRADIRSDTIAAIFAAADTVYLMNVEGDQLGVVPLHIDGYVAPTPPPDAARPDMNVRREWIGSFDLISDVEWLSNGDIAVAYRRQLPSEPVWSTILVKRSSRGAMQVRGSGRLVAAGPDDKLLFVDPGSDAQNRWLVGTLR